MDFSETQIHRYSRHILLPEIGGEGQARLLQARVLVVGAGGLGSPLILYLAAAGVGTIGIVDDDRVEISNLQRQVIHTTAHVGEDKVKSAARAIAALNPDVRVVGHNHRLTADNVAGLMAEYDIIADGSDNFATRLLLNEACHAAQKTLVSAAVVRFDGQLATWKPHAGGPCYRCFIGPAESLEDESCAQVGVLGAVAGTLGTLQATEVIKEILGIGQSAAGWLLIYDGLDLQFRRIKIKPDPACPVCGSGPKT